MIWVASISMVVLLVAVFCGGCFAVRQGYESAPYKVVRKDGSFELRKYPAMTLVQAAGPVQGDRGDNSFMRLFRYISGSNDNATKIPMTTPVFMNPDGSNTAMAFVMPAKMKPQATPKPTDEHLSIKEIAPGQFAVYRFSGSRSARSETESLSKLHSWLQTNQITPIEKPIYGYFDPPWTPTFMRRNEVMLRVQEKP